MHFMREIVEFEKVIIEKIAFEKDRADVFTKSLSRSIFK